MRTNTKHTTSGAGIDSASERRQAEVTGSPGKTEAGSPGTGASPARDDSSGPLSNRREFLGTVGSLGAVSLAAAGTARGDETPTVRMKNDYFDPIGLFVEPGTTVRFAIAEGSHSATAYESRVPDGATAFDTGVISSGSVSVTFDTPGTYDYYCLPHESLGMVGRIVVGSPGGPAEDSSIPAGDVPDSDTIVERGTVTDGGSGSSGRRRHGGMGGGGMGWGGPGGTSVWQLFFPLGMLTAMLGTLGAVVYGATRLGQTAGKENGE